MHFRNEVPKAILNSFNTFEEKMAIHIKQVLIFFFFSKISRNKFLNCTSIVFKLSIKMWLFTEKQKNTLLTFLLKLRKNITLAS